MHTTRWWLAVALAFAAAPAGAESVTLANGDVLEGTLVERGPEGIVLDHPVLGRLALAHEALRPAAPPRREPETRPPAWLAPLHALLGPTPPGWTRRLELGLSGAEGNTDVFDVVAALDFDAEDERRRWQIDGRYFHSTSQGETTKSRGHAELGRDWLVPGRKRFAFAEARWDFDRFEDWDHRVSLGGGPGYAFLEGPRLALRGNTGLFVTRTFGSPGRDRIDPEASFGAELRWRPDERNEFSFENVLRTSLRDPGELRNLTRASWRTRLVEESGLSFKLGAENEWESDVERGRKNDLTYYGSLVVDF